MIENFLGSLSSNLAVDLGTANILVYQEGRGIVSNEPSLVVIKEGNNERETIAVGQEAKSMSGRTPEGVTALRPMKDGVISDFEMTGEMLKHFISKVSKKRSLVKPRVIVCVPFGITEVEKRAVQDSAYAAGARKVYLVEEPMAAAIGAGLPVTEPTGSMIVDVGGGTTEVAVISMKGIVYSQSARVGGDKMDEAIQQHIRRSLNVAIGNGCAEQLKISLGSAMPPDREMKLEVVGRDLVRGLPTTLEVSNLEVFEALKDSLRQIVETIIQTLENSPPELAEDIVEQGITLAGGGSLLRDFDTLVNRATGLTAKLADDPLTAVVLGSGMILDRFEELGDVTSS